MHRPQNGNLNVAIVTIQMIKYAQEMQSVVGSGMICVPVRRCYMNACMIISTI